MDAIATLTTVCTVLMLLEYSSQIWKIYVRKTVADISFTYWLTKLTITTLQLVILLLSNNPLKVYLTQLLSLLGCVIIFSMMVHYAKKNK